MKLRNALKSLLLGLLLVSSVCLAQEDAAKIPAGAASPSRVNALRGILTKQVQKLGVQASAEKLATAARKEFVATAPELGKCGATPFIDEDVTLASAEKKLNADALSKFPQYTQKQFAAQAEKLFPLYKKGQKVSFRIRTNPRKTELISGYYNGMAGGNISIGQKSYRLADMTGIPGNDGPEGEIAKFDPVLNRKYRSEWQEGYIRDSAIGRSNFLEENKVAYIEKQYSEDFLENEKRGYTFYLGSWLTPDELADELAAEVHFRLNRQQEEQTRQEIDRRTREIAAQTDMTTLAAAVTPRGTLPSAEKVLRQNAETARRLEEQRKQREAEAALMAEREAEEARQLEARRQREAERRARRAAEEVETTEKKGISVTTYAVGGVLIVLLFLVIGWWWNRTHKEELDVSKFYEGKGKLQKEFWDAANADPEHFRYVSYLFPDMDTAKDALLRLSYISEDENGNLVSKKEDLRYGCYEHLNGAVAFIGSPTLNYARWREASMLWPDLPLANYFKVSSEPVVSLVLPDMEKMKTSGFQVESLGVEDVRTESGEINRVYRFKAPSKEEALKFLGTVDVTEEGLVIRVETPEEAYGKDINGVFVG